MFQPKPFGVRETCASSGEGHGRQQRNVVNYVRGHPDVLAFQSTPEVIVNFLMFHHLFLPFHLFCFWFNSSITSPAFTILKKMLPTCRCGTTIHMSFCALIWVLYPYLYFPSSLTFTRHSSVRWKKNVVNIIFKHQLAACTPCLHFLIKFPQLQSHVRLKTWQPSSTPSKTMRLSELFSFIYGVRIWGRTGLLLWLDREPRIAQTEGPTRPLDDGEFVVWMQLKWRDTCQKGQKWHDSCTRTHMK